MTNEQILKEEMISIVVDLKVKHNELGMKASGDWLDALHEQTVGLTGKVIGLHYSEYLESGRKPGGFPPIDSIIRWINDKGIKPIEDNMKISTLAFLIARKIAKDGWMREDHGGVELVTQVITPERVQRIINRVSEFNINSFTSQLTEFYKEFDAA